MSTLKKLSVCFLIATTLVANQVVGAGGPPSHYSAEAVSAKVIDADTKKPIEEVIVVAHWQLYYSTVGGRVPVGQLMVLETVTGKDGSFSFPAWGPKKAPKHKTQIDDNWIGNIPLFTPDTYLDDLDPALILFKPGYQYRGLQNPTRSYIDHSPVRRSMWDGRTIEMKPFKGTMEKWAGHLSFLHTSIRSILSDGQCEWKKIPRMVVAIDKQEKLFRAKNIYSPLYSVDDLPNGKCGSPKTFLREFMQ